MGGRGQSYHGGGGAPAADNSSTPGQLTPGSVYNGEVVGSAGITASMFRAMSTSEQAALISQASVSTVPNTYLASTASVLADMIGYDSRPMNIVSDAQLDAMSGSELFRTVNNLTNRWDDSIIASSGSIAKELTGEKHTWWSTDNQSLHGRGIYFVGADMRGSTVYGREGKDPKTIRCKADSSTKMTSEIQIDRLVGQAESHGLFSKVPGGIHGVAFHDKQAITAMANGYDGWISNFTTSTSIPHTEIKGYTVMINRSKLYVSSSVADSLNSLGNAQREWGSAQKSVLLKNK